MRLFVALAVASLAADASAQMTLADAVDRALAKSPGVATADAEWAAARAADDESRSARLPGLTLGGSASRYSDPAIATPIHGLTPLNLPVFDRTLLQSGVNASYVLFDAGARSARIIETSGLSSSAQASTEAARQTAAMRAIAAYATVLARAAMVDAQDARLRAFAAELDRVTQFEAVGRAPHVDRLRVEAAAAAAEAERISAAAKLDAAERELARLLDVDTGETRAAKLVPLEDRGDDLPDRAVLEQQAANSPLLRQAQLRAVAQSQSIAMASAARWPQVLASANQQSFATGRSVLEHDWNAGVQLRFSLFDGGATSARVARAASAAKAADEQFQTVRLENAVALDRAIADFQQNRAAVTSLGKAAERFDEVVRIEKLRLDNGAGTQTDYLRAEADLVAARSNLAAAKYGLIISRASAARIAGVLDRDWVAARFGEKR
ncbi:MAG TPA: TolC family protein [Thermoanaerobaculia bacterium]|nr:TolC family protein [Thermoanaerobaculia bacterium]